MILKLIKSLFHKKHTFEKRVKTSEELETQAERCLDKSISRYVKACKRLRATSSSAGHLLVPLEKSSYFNSGDKKERRNIVEGTIEKGLYVCVTNDTKDKLIKRKEECWKLHEKIGNRLNELRENRIGREGQEEVGDQTDNTSGGTEGSSEGDAGRPTTST